MLSARGEEYDKIHGFEYGVDDFVVKPFSPRELMMPWLPFSNAAARPLRNRRSFIRMGGSRDFTAGSSP
jgi:CheY-like chemotaxis protein